MGDRPLLPSVRSLLDMSSRMDISGNDMRLPPPHPERKSQRTPHASNPYSGPNSHNRYRASSSRLERDIQHQYSSRNRRSLDVLQHPPGSSSMGSRSSQHHSNHAGASRLPSVSEVLGKGRDSGMGDGWHHSSPRSNPSDYASSSQADGSSKKQGYPCERCGRLFTRKSDAQKHIRVVHDRVKNFACAVCGRRFGRKDYCTVCFSSTMPVSDLVVALTSIIHVSAIHSVFSSVFRNVLTEWSCFQFCLHSIRFLDS